MYRLLWRALPGPRWAKAIQALILAVVVFVVLMNYVFPAVSSLMPYNDVAV